MVTERKTLIINLIASSLVFFIQLLVNFWLSPFVISQLGESSYGFISLCNNFSEYATLLAISINSMASRFMSIEYNGGNQEKAKTIFSSVFWINVFFSIIIILSSSILITNLEFLLKIESSLVNDVKISMGITFLNLIISFISTCYISIPFITNKMTYNSLTQIIMKIISALILIELFISLSPHIYFVSLSTVCASLFGLIIYIYIKRKLLPYFSISWRYFDISQIMYIAKSGVWILVSNLNSIMLVGLDLLIANIFIDSSSMGRLSVSKLIPTVIGSILSSISNVFSASFTQIYAINNTTLSREVSFSLRILGLVFVVPFAGIIVLGQSFLNLWLPHDVYNESDIFQIYLLMILTLLNVIINAFMYSIHSLLIALNKIRHYSLLILLFSIISIISTILLVLYTNLGVFAIAGTSTVILGFVNLVIIPLYAESLTDVKHFTYMKPIFKNHLALMINILLFLILKPLFPQNSWGCFVVTIVLMGIIGYVLSFMLLLNKRERVRVCQSIYSKLNK